MCSGKGTAAEVLGRQIKASTYTLSALTRVTLEKLQLPLVRENYRWQYHRRCLYGADGHNPGRDSCVRSLATKLREENRATGQTRFCVDGLRIPEEILFFERCLDIRHISITLVSSPEQRLQRIKERPGRPGDPQTLEALHEYETMESDPKAGFIDIPYSMRLGQYVVLNDGSKSDLEGSIAAIIEQVMTPGLKCPPIFQDRTVFDRVKLPLPGRRFSDDCDSQFEQMKAKFSENPPIKAI